MLVVHKVSYGKAMPAVFSRAFTGKLQRTKNYSEIVYQNLTLFEKLSNYQIAIRIKIALEVQQHQILHQVDTS